MQTKVIGGTPKGLRNVIVNSIVKIVNETRRRMSLGGYLLYPTIFINHFVHKLIVLNSKQREYNMILERLRRKWNTQTIMRIPRLAL
ncbi:MAG: hypothetical protein ACTHKP_10010 [Nitrososphaeraceae archaeon]